MVWDLRPHFDQASTTWGMYNRCAGNPFRPPGVRWPIADRTASLSTEGLRIGDESLAELPSHADTVCRGANPHRDLPLDSRPTMTTRDVGPVTVMSDDQCWAQLASRTLGRLATSVDGSPDIFPVNYVVQRHTILIRTAEGTKLAAVAIHGRVAFEADDHDVSEGWSVVVKGQAQVLSTSEELADADRAQVLPWTATPKQRFIRVVPLEITGRRFQFGAEPDHLYDFG